MIGQRRIADSLETIEGALGRLERRTLLDLLLPGLAADEFRRALASVGLPHNDQLASLYGWRDGTSSKPVSLGEIYFFPGFYFLSAREALADYRAFVKDSRWSSGWFPFLSDGGGDFYVIDLGGDTVFPIRHFRLEESDHVVEYASVQDMLATLSEAYDRGIFFVDQDGHLEEDALEYERLAAEMNPDIRWWTD